MDNPSLLVIIDPNLGKRLLEVIQNILPNAHLVVIDDPMCIADPSERKAASRAARELIRSRKWDAILSLYQEFILHEDDLATTRLALNVHPSRPQIPGMVYDTWPLVEGTATYGWCGATVHFMTRGIDEGQVIRVEERELPADATYAKVRFWNQDFCVDLTQWLCQQIADASDLDSLERHLRDVAGECNRCWGTYVSGKERDEQLLALYEANPGHPVFEGNEKFKKFLKRSAAPVTPLA